jgi:hypothetical protein
LCLDPLVAVCRSEKATTFWHCGPTGAAVRRPEIEEVVPVSVRKENRAWRNCGQIFRTFAADARALEQAQYLTFEAIVGALVTGFLAAFWTGLKAYLGR